MYIVLKILEIYSESKISVFRRALGEMLSCFQVSSNILIVLFILCIHVSCE